MRSKYTVISETFEDKDAKAANRQRRNEKLWIQSSEKNSAVFDIQSLNLSIEVFLQSLSSQYPKSIGGVDTYQGSVRGTVIAFNSEEARDKACSVGIQVNSHTIHGTPTLSAESSVYRVASDKLPILRPFELSPLLQEAFKKYGKALHVGLYLDPKTNLCFSKGYVMLGTTNDQEQVYQPLTHGIPLFQRRIILATWRGMERHCFYCHKPGHTKSSCQRLQKQKTKSFYACGSFEHFVRDCPKTGSPPVGTKRSRIATAAVSSNVSNVETSIHSAHKNSNSDILSQEDPCGAIDALTNAQKDHVVSKEGVSTLAVPITDLAETNIDSDSEDPGDSDYVPSNESEKDSDESQDESATDNMSIDSQEVNDLQNEAGEIAAPTLENQEYKSDVRSSSDDHGIASLNCRGLKKILTQSGRSFSRILRSLPYDILALQETHASTEQLQNRFNLSLQVTSSNWTPHCGLVTFNSSISLTPLWSSTDGRIMATKITHISSLFEPITIYIVYAPATSTARFNFLNDRNILFQYNQSPKDRRILMGDFNHNLHRPTRSNRPLSWHRWIQQYWHDPIHVNSDYRDIPTFRSISTIDFLLVTNDLKYCISQPKVQYVPNCGHSAASMTVTLGEQRTGPGIWRCNPLLVNDKSFRLELTSFCDAAARHIPMLEPPAQWDHFKVMLKGFIQSFTHKLHAKRNCKQDYLQRRRRLLLRQQHIDHAANALKHAES
ncbi:hypothetical protein G6F43_000564 [Rhizopus delemar]|nr:hypothetical protein G6F43_000564 [Rhizopus delemar]